jgi:hypothetical protein
MIDLHYNFVYKTCKASATPWQKYCDRPWGPVSESTALIQHLPSPEEASQLEKQCILEEVRIGYLEFLYRCPWPPSRMGSQEMLGRKLASFSPTEADLHELEKTPFYPFTSLARRR